MTTFKSVLKGMVLAGAMAFASTAMADGFGRGGVRSAPSFAPAFSWTGFYVGLNAGGAWSGSDVAWSPNAAGFPTSGTAITTLSSGSVNGSGFSGGAQVGFNWQVNGLVLGAEIDWQSLDIGGSRTANLSTLLGGVSQPLSSSHSIDWLATARARIGLAFDRWLVYATGGFAWADVTVSDAIFFNATGTVNSVSRNDTVSGWVAGGGVEWAFLNNWTLRGEYLHVRLDDVNTRSANSNPVLFPNANIAHSYRNTDIDILRAAINFKF